MRYCGKTTCEEKVWKTDQEPYCPGCGAELTPCIRCRCWTADKGYHAEYNPRFPMGKFCGCCGTEWTPDYLAQCMAAQLKGMVNEVAEKQAGIVGVDIL